jgi:dTMP kinase
VQTDLDQLAKKLIGRFIVFDGPDGCGKGTQIRFLEQMLTRAGREVVVGTDPGGTVIGDRIRQVLLGYDLSEMDVRCETLLFMASRAQLVGEVIDPAVNAGKVVLCDRFVSATCAYQGAQGYDVKRVIEVAPYAIGDRWPDVTVILDVDVKTGFARTGRQPHHAGKHRARIISGRDHAQGHLFDPREPDAMEARPIEFHRRVRDIFLKLGEVYPRPVMVIDGRPDSETVHARVLEALARVEF